MESILTSVKKALGIAADYTHFDPDIIMHINSVLSALTQMGVGPETGYSITDATAQWTDFYGSSPALAFIKSYVFLKVRLIFDPPASSAVIESMNKVLSEFEWRITLAVEQADADSPAEGE